RWCGEGTRMPGRWRRVRRGSRASAMRAPRAVVIATITVGALTAVRADDRSRTEAKEAMEICAEGERAPGDTTKKLDGVARGIAAGEGAVAADGADGRAHLALFCNLGKELELSGLTCVHSRA